MTKDTKSKIETMISRERVLRAINHQSVDRVPIDLGMHYSTGISAFAYQNLREFLGLSTDNIEIIDIVQFLAKVDEDILKRFHSDCILLHPGWQKKHIWNPRGKYRFKLPDTANPKLQDDGSWLIEYKNQRIIMPKGGYFFDGGWPDFTNMNEETLIHTTALKAERIFKDSDYFTTYVGYNAYFKPDDLDWQCKMITDPNEIIEENEKIHEVQIDNLSKIIKNMGGYIQAIALNSDLGSQNGPLCNPELYRDLCAPYVKKLCDFVHQNSDLKVFLHCCGSIGPLIPTLIECGIDIINPVQISAANMDPSKLKEEFGKRITFWGGGCDTQRVLNNCTPVEVRENVKSLTEIFKPGGGFVFNQVHNIMGDISPENIVAMLDAAYENSFY